MSFPDNSANIHGAIALGRQMTVEFYDCSAEILADVRRMEEIFLHAAKVSGAHVVNSTFHSFAPQGVSGVLVISESHFAVHAWPEHDYAAVDLFTCGNGVDFDVAVHQLAEGMKSATWIISSLTNRGIIHESGQLERLVPVVENNENCGLQLSWQDRFIDSGAEAISCCIDIYNFAGSAGFNGEKFWHDFAGKLTCFMEKAAGNNWSFECTHEQIDFIQPFTSGRITGSVSLANRNLYLYIFAKGFFDPRPLAELAMNELCGQYYRMQVQIRQ